MRTFLILVSCLALATLGYAQGQDKPKKKTTQSDEASQEAQGPKKYQGSSGGGPQRYTPSQGHHNVGVGQGLSRGGTTPRKLGAPDTKTKTFGAPDTKRSTATAGGTAIKSAKGTKSFKAQRFNLASKSKPAAAKAPAVTFKQGTRIAGSQNWTGTSYVAFRNYTPVWHDRGWWHSHYNNIVFVFGGWYYWNAGYWYPAWGYAPNAYYFYDGPIYAYNDLPPDQVIANVQAALQEQGYYQGEVDGILGPLTRAAVARYQEDHGLYVTSAIDEPTLSSLGMV
jgi:hypothetical protein